MSGIIMPPPTKLGKITVESVHKAPLGEKCLALVSRILYLYALESPSDFADPASITWKDKFKNCYSEAEQNKHFHV